MLVIYPFPINPGAILFSGKSCVTTGWKMSLCYIIPSPPPCELISVNSKQDSVEQAPQNREVLKIKNYVNMKCPFHLIV